MYLFIIFLLLKGKTQPALATRVTRQLVKKILEGEKNTCNLTYVSTVKAFTRRMGLKYFSHSPVLKAAAHTQHIFSLEKLRH